MFQPSFVQKLKFARHVAFTDLIAYQGQLYLCVREASHHLSFDGRILVFQSKRGAKWSLCAEIESDQYDLRDPKWFLFQGRLSLLVPARDEAEHRENFVVPFEEKKLILQKLPLTGLVCWRPKRRGKYLYIPAYEPCFDKRNWRVMLLRTTTLTSFAQHTITQRGWGNETEVLLLKNRTLALVRREGERTLLASRVRRGWRKKALPFYWHAPAWQKKAGVHYIAVREVDQSSDPPEAQGLLYYGRSLSTLHCLPLTRKCVADMGYCGLAFFDHALWVSLYEGDFLESRVWIGAFSWQSRKSQRKHKAKSELSLKPVFS